MERKLFEQVKEDLLNLNSNNLEDYLQFFFTVCNQEDKEYTRATKAIIDTLFNIEVGYGKYSCPNNITLEHFLTQIKPIDLNKINFPQETFDIGVGRSNIIEMESYRIPDNITRLETCYIPAKKIIIPTTVQRLGIGCFENKANLIYEGTYKQWEELVSKFKGKHFYYGAWQATTIYLTTTDGEYTLTK